MRAMIPALAIVIGVIGLSGCADPYYSDSAYRPATTTTTTVVRDANGNPLSTAQTVRDANGNPVNSTGTYQDRPGYYQYVPGNSPPPYLR